MKSKEEKIYTLNDLIGESEAMLEIKQQIRLVAPTEARIFITGETGSGKTMIANIIHNLHPTRKEHHFRRTNIGALVPTLAQSQLYGHVANAFTGATKSDGIILESNKGTLFLDEIATAHPAVQVMLLNLLEIPVVNPVGGSVKDRKKVNIRIISATTSSPHELLNHESFRRELFFRISEYVIELKPLRERREDINLLAKHFIKENNKRIRCPGILMEDGKPSKPFPPLDDIEPEALKMLEDYDWPGNVREFEHVIRSAMVESREDPGTNVLKKEWIKFSNYTIEPKDKIRSKNRASFPGDDEKKVLFSWDINWGRDSKGNRKVSLKQQVDQLKNWMSSHILRENNDNRSLSARMLGIDVASLNKYKENDLPEEPLKNSKETERMCRVYVVKE